jgi:hypothetical protein
MRGPIGALFEYVDVIPVDTSFMAKDLTWPIPGSVLHKLEQHGWIRKIGRVGEDDLWKWEATLKLRERRARR